MLFNTILFFLFFIFFCFTRLSQITSNSNTQVKAENKSPALYAMSEEVFWGLNRGDKLVIVIIVAIGLVVFSHSFIYSYVLHSFVLNFLWFSFLLVIFNIHTYIYTRVIRCCHPNEPSIYSYLSFNFFVFFNYLIFNALWVSTENSMHHREKKCYLKR